MIDKGLYEALIGRDKPLNDKEFEALLTNVRGNGAYITKGMEIMSHEQKVIMLTEIMFLIETERNTVQNTIKLLNS